MSGLTHLNEQGQARMVDITDKAATSRTAVAEGRVMMEPATLRLIRDGGLRKGEVLSVARLAGIMGAKKTADLIPLCHPIGLSSVALDLTLDEAQSAVIITATCKVTSQTGVEMEALTAVSIAALTIYDMCKAVDRAMIIGPIKLREKSGGQSGDYRAA